MSDMKIIIKRIISMIVVFMFNLGILVLINPKTEPDMANVVDLPLSFREDDPDFSQDMLAIEDDNNYEKFNYRSMSENMVTDSSHETVQEISESNQAIEINYADDCFYSEGDVQVVIDRYASTINNIKMSSLDRR